MLFMKWTKGGKAFKLRKKWREKIKSDYTKHIRGGNREWASATQPQTQKEDDDSLDARND